MRRIVLLGIILLAIAWILLASKPDNALGATPITDRAATAPLDGQIPTSGTAANQDAIRSPVAEPSADPAPSPGAPASTASASTASLAPDRTVHGAAAAPNGGKPVAPVELEWDLAVASDGSRAFRGTITLIPRSGPARIAATVTGVQGATLTGTTSFAFNEVAIRQRIVLPIGGRAAPGAEPGGVTVAVSYITSDTRGRSVLIELRDPTQAPTPAREPVGEPPAAPGSDAPLQGVHIIRDNNGELIILQPSTPPKR